MIYGITLPKFRIKTCESNQICAWSMVHLNVHSSILELHIRPGGRQISINHNHIHHSNLYRGISMEIFIKLPYLSLHTNSYHHQYFQLSGSLFHFPFFFLTKSNLAGCSNHWFIMSTYRNWTFLFFRDIPEEEPHYNLQPSPSLPNTSHLNTSSNFLSQTDVFNGGSNQLSESEISKNTW